jgi:hypothetical protein
VPVSFRYSMVRSDGQTGQCLRGDYPQRDMEFGLCLSRFFEAGPSEGAKFTARLLPECLPIERASPNW